MTSAIAARLRRAFLCPVFLISAAGPIALPVSAIEIKITDATPTYEATRATCTGWDGKAYKDCKSKAKIDDKKSADAKNDAFGKSFKAWNDANAAGKKWTLKDGGALPGGTLNVNIFDALAFEKTGGLEIRVEWDYAGADKDQFFWSQGLYDNFAFSPDRVVKPMYEMDVKPAGCDDSLLKKCPPLYPFQYADRHFYDKPLGVWPDSFFDAVSFLSKVDAGSRELTIYEGLAYGFALSATLAVPEPTTWALLVAGLLLLALVQRTRRPAGR
jgi:hypothetical protein